MSSQNRTVAKAGARTVRETNRALLLDLIRREGALTRSELARRSALAKPTVSAIVDSLIAQDIVREIGPEASRLQGGPRGMLLNLNPDAEAFVGIHLTVGRTSLAIADARGCVRETTTVGSHRGDVALVLRDLPDLVSDVMSKARLSRQRLRGVGVAIPGLVDHRSGECVLAPHLPPHLRKVPLGAALGAALGVPVLVRNSTQAGAIAEARLGASAAVDSFAWIDVGNAVGAAIVMDGRVVYGKRGYTGELGHWQVVPDGSACECGRRGCLETVASDHAIEAAARQSSEGSSYEPGAAKPIAAEIARAAAEGDRAARTILARAGEYLGIGISYLVNLLDLEKVVLDGAVVRTGDYFIERVRASVASRARSGTDVSIVRSSVGDDVVLRGSVFLAMGGDLAGHVAA